MGRSPCCSKEGLNRGAWTAIEDRILTAYIKAHGEGKWRNLPKRAGLKRCGKSCRLRWMNYLRPDIKRGNISHDEEELIIRLHKLLGNRWSLIAGRLPGRTDNEIKNYWNTTLAKKALLGGAHASSPKSTSKKTKSRPKRPPPQPPKSSSDPPPAAIRTKASRCTTRVLAPAQTPNPEILEAHQSQSTNFQFCDKSTVECENQDLRMGNVNSHGSFFKFSCDEFQDQLHVGHSQGTDLFKSLGGDYNLPALSEFILDDVNGSDIDLGSLESFLACEEWP